MHIKDKIRIIECLREETWRLLQTTNHDHPDIIINLHNKYLEFTDEVKTLAVQLEKLEEKNKEKQE